MADAYRPEMLQTYTPFVEMYIKGRDILRGLDGRPRSLISFSHAIHPGNFGGFWEITVFDPDIVALEELLVSLGNEADSTEVAEEAYGGTGAEEEAKNFVVNGAYFRYGYTGVEGEVISSVGMSGEKYYYGNVHSYSPSYQAEGTYITLRGDSAFGGLGFPKSRVYEATSEKAIDIVKRVCKEEGWIFQDLHSDEPKEDLDEERVPILPVVCHASIDSTEESPTPHRRKENQDPTEFIDELCLTMRPSHPEYGAYIARWEARANVTPDESGNLNTAEPPTTYLFFGPESVKDNIVRKYIYLRDAKSDIISFTPSINYNLMSLGGTAGITYKTADVRLGMLDYHFIDELNRQQKLFRGTRPQAAHIPLASLGAYQKGVEEYPNEEMNPEGAQTGPQKAAPQEAPDPDAPIVEIATPLSTRERADYEIVNYWLSSYVYVNSATLQVFGDPSPALAPGRLVAIAFYVPAGEEQLELHWLSGLYIINNVTHNISAGSFVTTMELNNQGTGQGGVTTKAFYRAITEGLSPEGMRRAGG